MSENKVSIMVDEYRDKYQKKIEEANKCLTQLQNREKELNGKTRSLEYVLRRLKNLEPVSDDIKSSYEKHVIRDVEAEIEQLKGELSKIKIDCEEESLNEKIKCFRMAVDRLKG